MACSSASGFGGTELGNEEPPIAIGLPSIAIKLPPIAIGLPPGMLSVWAPAEMQLFTIHPEGFITVPPSILACRQLARSTCFSSGSCFSSVFALLSMTIMICCTASEFDGTEFGDEEP